MASIPSLSHFLLAIITISTIVSTEKCTNPLPAIMQMASGVDITLLDLFPIGDSSGKRGFLENVFNFTCSGVKIGQKLKNKDDGGDFSDYDLPDQISGVSVKPNVDCRLYDKVRRVRDRHFLGPVIDDLYVIASTRLEFAKQICTFSFKRFVKGHWSQCPDSVVRNGESATSDHYDSYHNAPWYSLYSDDSVSGYMNALEETRSLNRRYGFRADMTNGLRASCGDCSDY